MHMAICKTGAEHLASLKDGRTVYIDGALVDDVTVHPAFRRSVASAASLYDFQTAPENLELMTFAPEHANRRIRILGGSLQSTLLASPRHKKQVPPFNLATS